MKIIALKCPNCNANIELNRDKEFGFCNYCGTKIMIADAVQKVSGTVNINRTSEIGNILRRARDYENREMLDEAERYYDRALDIDIDNREAQEGLERVKTTILDPNVIVERPPAEGSYYEPIIIEESGVEVCRLGMGERSFIKCSVGRHTFDIKTKNRSIKARIIITGRQDMAKIYLWNVRGNGLCAKAVGSASIITKGTPDAYQPRKKEKPSGCLIFFLVTCAILFVFGILVTLAGQ